MAKWQSRNMSAVRCSVRVVSLNATKSQTWRQRRLLLLKSSQSKLSRRTEQGKNLFLKLKFTRVSIISTLSLSSTSSKITRTFISCWNCARITRWMNLSKGGRDSQSLKFSAMCSRLWLHWSICTVTTLSTEI